MYTNCTFKSANFIKKKEKQVFAIMSLPIIRTKIVSLTFWAGLSTSIAWRSLAARWATRFLGCGTATCCPPVSLLTSSLMGESSFSSGVSTEEGDTEGEEREYGEGWDNTRRGNILPMAALVLVGRGRYTDMLGCSMSKFSSGEEARGAVCDRVKHGGGVMSHSCVAVSPTSPAKGSGDEASTDEGTGSRCVVVWSSPWLTPPSSAGHHYY